MAKVITFSRAFQKSHPKAGQPTYFVEKLAKGFPPFSADDFTPVKDDADKDLFSLLPLAIDIWADLKPKLHTIRAGKRWKVGDMFSPRVWSGKPYCSKQITIAPDIEIKKVWDFEIKDGEFLIDNRQAGSLARIDLAINDGLDYKDMLTWFKYPKPFDGQIICWDENLEY